MIIQSILVVDWGNLIYTYVYILSPTCESLNHITVGDRLPTSVERLVNWFSLCISVLCGGFKAATCLGSLVCKEGIRSVFSRLRAFQFRYEDMRLTFSNACPVSS